MCAATDARIRGKVRAASGKDTATEEELMLSHAVRLSFIALVPFTAVACVVDPLVEADHGDHQAVLSEQHDDGVAASSLVARLSWNVDVAGDLDLHLVRASNGAFCARASDDDDGFSSD